MINYYIILLLYNYNKNNVLKYEVLFEVSKKEKGFFLRCPFTRTVQIIVR